MACLVCLLLLAVITDLRSYKISNHLILTGIITGILFDLYEYGQAGISLWLPGILLPVILLFPLFLIKALGAGDIKLFSVIGSFYGAAYVLKSIAAAFILGAVMSLIYLLKYKMVFSRFRHLFNYIRRSITNLTNDCVTMDISVDGTKEYPRALPNDFVSEYSNKLSGLVQKYHQRKLLKEFPRVHPKKHPGKLPKEHSEEHSKEYSEEHSEEHSKEHSKKYSKEHLKDHSEEDIQIKGRIPEPYYNKDRDGRQGVIHFSIAVTGAVLLQIIYPYL